MSSLHSASLRTTDVARRSGYSVQQIRNLERDGVLAPAPRTESNYRVYRPSHVDAALAYRALAAGVGPVEAKHILRAVHAGRITEVLARVDAAHARLHTERRDVALAADAVRVIAEEPLEDARPSDAMTISELAGALGVRPSALRHWDAMGIVVPRRGSRRDARRYTPADVRDARIVHQLRLAGYGIPALQVLMPTLRQVGRWKDVMAVLTARERSLDARSRSLLDGAGALTALIPAGPDPHP